MKILKLLSLTLVGVFVVIGIQGCSKTDPNSATGEKTNLTIGFDVEFPPMGFEQNNEFVGFDIDLAKAALATIGYTATFQPINWDSKEIELSTGKIDLIWNGFTYTPDRAESLELSQPYLTDDQIVVVRKDSGITTIDQLKGKKLAAQKGGSGYDVIKDNPAFKDFFSNIIQVDSIISILDEVENGTVDAAVLDAVNLYDVEKSGKGDIIVSLDKPIDEATIVVGANKGNTELIAKIDQALKNVKDNGTTASISNAWFGKDLSLSIQ
jgi:polar amino acid transport system substrate-binding protein